MSDQVEVNTSYRGVASSWLGLDTNIYTNLKNKAGQQHDQEEDSRITSSTKETKCNPAIKTNLQIKNKIEKRLYFNQKDKGEHQYNSNKKSRYSDVNPNKKERNPKPYRSHKHGRDQSRNEIDTVTPVKIFKTTNTSDESGKKRTRDEDNNEQEESKSSQVKGKKPKQVNSSTSQTIHELNARLLDSTLSKKARKRLRKKLATLTNS